MSLHRTKATIVGLLETSRVNEWIVTEKLGDALKVKAGTKALKKPRFRIEDRYKSLLCPQLFHSIQHVFKMWFINCTEPNQILIGQKL